MQCHIVPCCCSSIVPNRAIPEGRSLYVCVNPNNRTQILISVKLFPFGVVYVVAINQRTSPQQRQRNLVRWAPPYTGHSIVVVVVCHNNCVLRCSCLFSLNCCESAPKRQTFQFIYSTKVYPMEMQLPWRSEAVKRREIKNSVVTRLLQV